MTEAQEMLLRNLSNPHGALGHKVGEYMATENFKLNTWAIKLLDIQKMDQILEIGFGPGTSIREMAALASEGFIAGLDYSGLMVQQATRLNKEAIQQGRISLFHGNVASLPDFQRTFDKVISVNNIMYWEDPVQVLTDLKKVMNPSGTISIVFQRCDDHFRQGRCDAEIDLYKYYLQEAGYCHIQIAAHPLTLKRPNQKKQIVAGISIRGYNTLVLPAITQEYDLASLLDNSNELSASSVILQHNLAVKAAM